MHRATFSKLRCAVAPIRTEMGIVSQEPVYVVIISPERIVCLKVYTKRRSVVVDIIMHREAFSKLRCVVAPIRTETGIHV